MMPLGDMDKKIAVITSTYVIEEKMPILYISNDDDEGGFILHFDCDNGDYDGKKMLVVGLGTILKIDSDLAKISLELGEEARRESVSSDWIIKGVHPQKPPN